MKTEITKRTHQESQTLYHTRVYHIGVSTPYRIKIERDAYDHQSRGLVHRWNGDEWKLLLEVPIEELACHALSVYASRKSKATHTDFDKDCEALITEACEITGDDRL